MTQHWAIIGDDGAIRTRCTASADIHPASEEAAGAFEGCKVVPLPRELGVFETVDPETLEIVMDVAAQNAAAIAEIKASAQRQILEIAPLWKQANALRDPDADWAVELWKQVDAIRAQSNDDERKLINGN
jgi:hypothetical protein